MDDDLLREAGRFREEMGAALHDSLQHAIQDMKTRLGADTGGFAVVFYANVQEVTYSVLLACGKSGDLHLVLGLAQNVVEPAAVDT